jgi:glycosyltransferase involved in cell wall biosynthesis
MHRKKKILVLVDWYLPGYKAGGPIQSVANMVSHLHHEFDFAIITSDTDLHADQPYDSIVSDVWNQRKDGSKVYYFSKGRQHYSELKKIILEEQADVIYLNSLFSVFFTIYPLLIRKRNLPSRKVVLAPRGMLGKGALNIKPLKKKLFLMSARLMSLYHGIRWQASSSSEAEEIRNVFGKRVFIQTALNLTAVRSLNFIFRTKNPDILRAVFISRIAGKKNLEGTLKILLKLPPSCRVDFDIYGPVEDPEYWAKCEAVIATMPSHIKVSYKGEINNEKVPDTLSAYHLSILLTFNENFGHSIVESMAAGCPVLLSDQTPWRGLMAQKAGWDIALVKENEILEAIVQITKMNQEEFDEWSRAAQEYAAKIINNPTAIEQNKLLFA